MTGRAPLHDRNVSQARLDGQMAALAGSEPGDNPYPLGTVFSRAWGRGWREIVERRG